jgi:hypothetical protein
LIRPQAGVGRDGGDPPHTFITYRSVWFIVSIPHATRRELGNGQQSSLRHIHRYSVTLFCRPNAVDAAATVVTTVVGGHRRRAEVGGSAGNGED